MSQFDMTVSVYSPRWGRSDAYRLTFTRDRLVVTRGEDGSAASCALGPAGGPEWSGFGAEVGNPLLTLFLDDRIHAPPVVPAALASAWVRWRGGGVSNEDLLAGVVELFVWVDRVASHTPTGSFWSGVL